MILPKAPRLTPEQVAVVTEIAAAFGCRIQTIVGTERSIYALVGDERDDLLINRLEGLDFVERVDRIQSPHKLMDRRSDLASHRVRVGGVTLGECREMAELETKHGIEIIIGGSCLLTPLRWIEILLK
jgi:3-deoxy-7-phosphoheptulonate synthase